MIARLMTASVAVFLCLLMTGCAASQSMTESLFVSQSTARFIQATDEDRWATRAAEVERVAERAKAVLRDDPEVTMGGLRSVLREQIPMERLTPADRDVLRVLADHYAQDAPGHVDDEYRTRLSRVFEQAIVTARAYQ